MSEPKYHARARVRVTLDIPLATPWGEECPLSQIRKQAAADALQLLRCGVAVNGLTAGGHPNATPVEIVGEPDVTAILVKESRP